MNSRSKSVSARGAGRRARRSEDRRLEILRAASLAFRRRGYAGAGMREIAAEAELSPANLYHYFKGKPEILYFCQDRWLDRMESETRRAARSAGPVLPRLHAVLRAHVLCLLDERGGSAAHLETDDLPPRLRARLVARRDRYERALRRLVAAGVRRGELAPCDPGLVTRAILGALNWTARWFRPDGAQTPEALADGLAGYLVRGLDRHPARNGSGRV